jgi:hypothetical protein
LNLPGLTSTDPSILTCASINGQAVRCPLPANDTAEFIRQTSKAACVTGTSYFIRTDHITVTNGCRAEFRLVEQRALTGPDLTDALRHGIVNELATRLRADFRLNFTPIVDIRSDSQRFLTGTDVGFSGEARVNMNNNAAKLISFDSVFGTRSRDFSNVTYRVLKDSFPIDVGPGDTTFSPRLRAKLALAMRAKLQADVPGGRNSEPNFEITSDNQRTISSHEVGFSGKGRIMTDGRNWRPIEFDSIYDSRTDILRGLSYRLIDSGTGSTTGSWRPGTSMDENNLRTLAAALAEDIRTQKGGGHVQVVINSRYEEAPVGTGTVNYRGKFGYSYNDEFWVTRGFEVSMSLTQNKVLDLRVYRVK